MLVFALIFNELYGLCPEFSMIYIPKRNPCIFQVMSAQEEVLRKERELQEARKQLAAINKSRYEKSPEPQ